MTHSITQNSKLKLALILVISLFSFLSVVAQVTIGSAEKPKSGALLDLKEIVGILDASHDSYKGVALPRVALSDKKQLYPMFLADPEDSNSGANSEYTNNKAELDKSHTGLIVYNTIENDDKELCLGLNQWDGEQWVCFQSKMGNAQFDPVDCANIRISGQYVEGQSLDASHYITMELNATREGAYTVEIETGNGYSFYATGVALSKGPVTINLPGQGQPIAVGTDLLAIKGVTLVAGCAPSITVASDLAEFALSCSDITVEGQYLKGQILGASNVIKVRVNVAKLGSYRISAPLTNGISFEAAGEFTTLGSQWITLGGFGTPTVLTDFQIPVVTTSPQGNTTCEATIPITLPAMTYGVIGSGGYSWVSAERQAALNPNNGSFSPNGIVRIVSFTQKWSANSANAALPYFSQASLPDVVLYFAYGAPPTPALSAALADYIKKGGCVIYSSSDRTSAAVNDLLEGVFGMRTAEEQILGTGSGNGYNNADSYEVITFRDNPIANGPFGDARGLRWCEDSSSSGSVIMTELPAGSIQICSAQNDYSKSQVLTTNSIVWMNDVFNFVYFGDSVATSSATSGEWWPSRYTANGIPFSVAQTYGPGKALMANSTLEMNAVAWAIRKAAVSGVNPY